MLLESWISPKTVKGQPSKIAGKGFFAVQPIKKGEVVCVKLGHVIDKSTLEANKEIIQGSELQINDDLYLAPKTIEELPLLMAYANHSCEPNCGFGGNILVVAMRDIEPGEELTIDYAMHLSGPDFSLTCNCQTASCRHTISGNDWQIPELQEKYKGYFVWYIEKKITEQQAN